MRKHSVWLLPLLLACQLSSIIEPTPAPTSAPATVLTPTSESSANEQVPLPSGPLIGSAAPLPVVEYPPFAPAGTAVEPPSVQIPAVVPLYSTNIEQIDLLERFGLSSEERELLGEAGFLVRSGQPSTIEAIYGANGPHIVTADLVLLLTHGAQQAAVQDIALKFAPRNYFEMMADLSAATEQQLSESLAAGETLSAEAAKQNLAILTIGGRLFDRNWPIPTPVQELVGTELVLFESGGKLQSAILQREVDYDRFGSELSAVERVGAWFDQSGIVVAATQSMSQQRIAGRQIELLLDIWLQGESESWKTVYRLADYRHGANATHIQEWLALRAATADSDSFLLSAVQLQQPVFHMVPRSASSAAFQQQIFEQLTFNKVGAHSGFDQLPVTAVDIPQVGPVRTTPRLLDVAAALGSDAALDRLRDEEETGFEGWETQLVNLRSNLSEARAWPAGWRKDQLAAWQTILEPARAYSPAYIRSDEWASHRVGLWENGFTLLSLNTVIDPTASFAPEANRPIFLEHHPQLYGKLAAQTRALAEGHANLGNLDEANGQLLLGLESDLLKLQAIAQSGLAGLPPTADDMIFLRSIVSRAAAVSLGNEGLVFIGSNEANRLVGRYGGVAPTIFVVLNVDQQIAVLGGRIQTTVERYAEN